MNNTHHLKLEKAYWDAVKSGFKTFEIRKNDRGFQNGDKVIFHKYSTKPKSEFIKVPYYDESGDYHYMVSESFVSCESRSEKLEFTIKYILPLSVVGIDSDMVVFGLEKKGV